MNDLELEEVLADVIAVTKMELHQVATGETLPGYRVARRAAETKLWVFARELAYSRLDKT